MGVLLISPFLFQVGKVVPSISHTDAVIEVILSALALCRTPSALSQRIIQC